MNIYIKHTERYICIVIIVILVSVTDPGAMMGRGATTGDHRNENIAIISSCVHQPIFKYHLLRL